MLTAPKKNISETFLIWNEDINFVGGLISSPEGSAKICGRVVFKNDSEVLFSSQTGDRRVLHQKLVSTCQFIFIIKAFKFQLISYS